MGERGCAFTVLAARLGGKRQLGRPRRLWEDNIKIVFQELGGGTDWINLAQDTEMWRAFVNAVLNLRVS